jgi:uncharacterized protein YbcI
MDQSSPVDAAMLERLQGALADQFAALYDAQPVDPHAQLAGNVLTFSFHGGFSRADESLLEAGRETELHDFRLNFLDVVGGQLGEVVEALSGRRVRRVFTAFDPAGRITECLFTFDESEPDESEQRRALLNWSEQVRRNARDLRERHRAARQAYSRQIEALAKVRRDLHDD